MSEIELDNGSGIASEINDIHSTEALTEDSKDENLELNLWKSREEDLLNEIAKHKADLNKEKFKVSNLETQLQERIKERDILKIESAKLEKALAKNSIKHVKNKEQNSSDMIIQAKSVIFEKTKVCKNQELQIDALKEQVKSLKEIVTISKDMLDIRNLEVQQLQEKLNCMDLKFTAERERHNLMNKKLDRMIELNADLKNEYNKQLITFSALQKAYDLQQNIANGVKTELDDAPI